MDIKDYIHYYIGQKAIVSHRNTADYEVTITPAYIGDPTGVFPILVPLSQLQHKNLVDIQTLYAEAGDKQDAYEWAISGGKSFHLMAVITTHLLKQGFDLFGLIDEGLAINKKLIENKNVRP